MQHPCAGCGALVGIRTFACGGCWRRLPGNFRTAILRAWGRRQHGVKGAHAEHTTAKTTAREWFAAHPREEAHQ
jgi:hypothetical protein